MANIPNVQPFAAIGAAPVAPVVLGLSNTLTYKPASKQILYVRNASAASVTATLKGSAAPTASKIEGTGRTEDLSAGQVFTIAAGATWAIPLSNFRAYLPGNVTLVVSLAADMTAWIAEV